MEERIGLEKVHILTEYSQKIPWEKQLRSLWYSCFGDPQHYEDFYFDQVYAKNRVYTMEDKGMIHVNPYRCKVLNREMTLPYIVGVSTDKRYRRQGVMRTLLERVISDLFEQRVPFAYLMPAKEEYYLPFGFRSISKRVEYQVDCDAAKVKNHFQYLSYKEIQKMTLENRLQIFAEVNQWLEVRYDVYAIHDETYYDLLYAEKSCQSGDVVFCFDDMIDRNHLIGVFAYAMEEDVPYVEQMIVKEGCQVLPAYFADYKQCKVAKAYPYMIRIVHREAFLELFGDRLSKLCDKPLKELTDAQMIELLFTEKNRIYFAEIV